MGLLKEIFSISKFKPTKGPLFEVYQLIVKNGATREEASIIFEERKELNKFYLNYNRLKEKGLEGILTDRRNGLTIIQRKQLEVYKKFLQCKILYVLHQRIAFTTISESTIKKAEKVDLFNIALSISRDLQKHYSEVAPNEKKFTYYQNKIQTLNDYLSEELKIERIYTRLIFSYRKQQLKKDSFKELAIITKTYQKNTNFRFRLWYHIAKNIQHDYNKDVIALLENTKEALAFFDGFNRPMPYAARFNFLMNLIPIYINQKDFTKAERTINASLVLPTKGSYNWHLVLLYKAMYGFKSNKPSIALSAWKKAHSIPKKFTSKIITDQWSIIAAYLSFYEKAGRLQESINFRLYRFLNTFKQGGGDKNQKANLLTIVLIHLLIDKKLKAFTEKTFLLEGIITRDFNQHKYRRTKYFLCSMKAIVKGNFHPVGAKRHANTYIEKMRGFESLLDFNALEREVVPYDFIWEEVLGGL